MWPAPSKRLKEAGRFRRGTHSRAEIEGATAMTAEGWCPIATPPPTGLLICRGRRFFSGCRRRLRTVSGAFFGFVNGVFGRRIDLRHGSCLVMFGLTAESRRTEFYTWKEKEKEKFSFILAAPARPPSPFPSPVRPTVESDRSGQTSSRLPE